MSQTLKPDEGIEGAAPIALPEGARVHELAPDLVLFEIPNPQVRLCTQLTAAEREIARAVFEGASNEAIARSRGVGIKTVDKQLESIYRKLGVTSRVELVLALREASNESSG